MNFKGLFSEKFDFTPSTHSTNAPYSSSSLRCSYHKDKRAKPGNVRKSEALVRN